MPANWFTIDDNSRQLDSAGIYQWLVDGTPIYTGRAVNLRSRLRQYERNISRLEANQPYRRGDPAGFREIHRALRRSALSTSAIEFRIVENCEPGSLNERERYHQQQMPGTTHPGTHGLERLLAKIGRLVFYWGLLENALADAIRDLRKRLAIANGPLPSSFAERLTKWCDLAGQLPENSARQALALKVHEQTLELRGIRNLIVHGLQSAQSRPSDGPASIVCGAEGHDFPTPKTVTYTADDLDHFAEALDACRRAFSSLDNFNYELHRET